MNLNLFSVVVFLGAVGCGGVAAPGADAGPVDAGREARADVEPGPDAAEEAEAQAPEGAAPEAAAPEAGPEAEAPDAADAGLDAPDEADAGGLCCTLSNGTPNETWWPCGSWTCGWDGGESACATSVCTQQEPCTMMRGGFPAVGVVAPCR